MAPKLSTTRAVVEHLAELDLNNPPFAVSASITIRSIAIATLPVDGAVDQHKTLIFIGTHCGKIFLFSLNPTDQDSGTSSNSTARSDVVNADNNSSISYVRSALVSQAPVESINVVANVQKIVVVSDGFIYLVDSLLLQLVKKLGSFKGVSVIARRRILPRISGDNASDDLNYVESSSDREEVLGQLFLKKLGGVGVRSNGLRKSAKQLSFEELMLQKKDSHCMFVILVWKRLLLAELTIDRSNDGSFVVLKEIQCVDDRVVAMVWIDNAVIVGTSNGYTMYSCLTGQNRLIFSLPDLCCPPQLKFLAKECNVLLMLDNVGISVNAEGQPVGGSLVFGCAPDAVGELESNIIVAQNGKAKIYHKKSSKCVQNVTFAIGRVGQCIVVDEENGSGKFVIVATPSKVICYQKVAVERQIKDLLRKKSFKEAISLVEELESEGELTNEMLSVFHAQVGFLLLFNLHFEEAVDHFLLSETMQPSELFPFIMRDPNRWSLLVPRNRYWGLHPPPALLEKIVDDGLMGIQRGIFLKKAGVETAIDDEFLLNPLSRADLLESAIKSFIRYLQVSRGKDLTPSMKEGVDTLLMYLYRALNRVDDMERLASVENSCVVEELETLLNDSGHLRTLAFLYASKGMDSKALSVWRILARNYSSGFWKHSSGENESETISRQETMAIEASKILEESSDQDLILEHLGWVADISQVIAVHVLTSEKRTILLSPDQVIASIDSRKVEILQRYLQWLIEDQGSDNTQYHTTYALLLAKSAVEAYEREKASTSSEARSIDEKGIGDSEWHSIFRSPLSDRLQIFLHSSDLYDPEEVLDLIEKSELWLEKAILYRKLGQESLVLEILALKLEDCEAAEQYCAEIGRPDAYMQLLELYLNPKGGKEPMFKSAVRLLHNHGESLDPLQVLERLSSDMPLQLASDTILRMLRARLHHHRQGQIVHNMSRAMDIDASMARLEERSRHVQINDESLCDSCHARLGTKLFAMYPDDTVVCYKCFRRQGESVSVSGRDFKQDAIIKQGWLVTR